MSRTIVWLVPHAISSNDKVKDLVSDPMYKEDLEEWEEQYHDVFDNELEAYKHALKEVLEKFDDSETTGYKVMNSYEKKWLEMMWKYEPENIKKQAPWRHNIVKEVTDGEVLL